MLTLSHISKTFNPGTVNEKKALTDLSLHLDAGDFVTIIGSNGAGKSTLFNAVSGSFFVDEGSIIVDGRDITFMPEYRRAKHIGRLFHSLSLRLYFLPFFQHIVFQKFVNNIRNGHLGQAGLLCQLNS